MVFDLVMSAPVLLVANGLVGIREPG